MDTIHSSNSHGDTTSQGEPGSRGLARLTAVLASASAQLDNGWIDDAGLHVWRSPDGSTPSVRLACQDRQVTVELRALDGQGQPLRLQAELPDYCVHVHDCDVAFSRTLLILEGHKARSLEECTELGPWPVTLVGWQLLQNAGLDPVVTLRLSRDDGVRGTHWRWTFAQNPKVDLWTYSYQADCIIECKLSGLPARAPDELETRLLVASAPHIRLRKVDRPSAAAAASVAVARSSGAIVHVQAQKDGGSVAESCTYLDFTDAPILPSQTLTNRRGSLILDVDSLACRAQVSFHLDHTDNPGILWTSLGAATPAGSTAARRLAPWAMVLGNERLADVQTSEKTRVNFLHLRAGEALAMLSPALATIMHDGVVPCRLLAQPQWILQASQPCDIPSPPGVGLAWGPHPAEDGDQRSDGTANALSATAMLASVATGTPLSMAVLADLRGFELRLSAVATRNDRVGQPVLVAQDFVPLGAAHLGLLALGDNATSDDLANFLGGLHEGSEAAKTCRTAGRLFYEVICTLAAEFCAALLADVEWFRDVWYFTSGPDDFPESVTAADLRSELSVSLAFSGWGFAPLWSNGRLMSPRELEMLRQHLIRIASCGDIAAPAVSVRLPAAESVRLGACGQAPSTSEEPGAAFGAWTGGHSRDLATRSWPLPSTLLALGFTNVEPTRHDSAARRTLSAVARQAMTLLARALRLPHPEWFTVARNWREVAEERIGPGAEDWSVPALSRIGVSSLADFRAVLPDHLNPFLWEPSFAPNQTRAAPAGPRTAPAHSWPLTVPMAVATLGVGARQLLADLKVPALFVARFECAAPDDFDLELAALLIGDTGRMASEADMVFFNNEQHPSGAVCLLQSKRVYSTSGAVRIRSLRFDLGVVPSSIDRIAVFAFIYDGEARGQSFAQTGGLSFALRLAEQPLTTIAVLAKDCALRPRTDGIRAFDLVRNRRAASWSIDVGAGAIVGGIAAAYELLGT